MIDDIAAFVDCIENDDRPLITAREAAQPVEILMAAFMSAARNEEVQLPIPRIQTQEKAAHD
jgi:predicted dehydrogenase